MRLSRRALLLTGGTATTGVALGAWGVERGVLPGRPFLQEALGLNGEDGVIPDVEPGPVESGEFVSDARLGETVRWHLIRPPGGPEDLPVVVALHGRSWTVDAFLPGEIGVPEFLAAAVADGVPPFAIAAAQGSNGYWHPRPDGEDSGAMITEEFLPLLAERGLRATPSDRIGLAGWSMGGYGALRLGGVLGAERVAAVQACSPAVWRDADDVSDAGFDDADEYAEYTVFGRQDELAGIAVRIDCGTGDPFFREVEAYVDDFPGDADVVSTFEPGGHDRGYWRRMLPDELAFLGTALA